jgi:hypothetical protein
MPLLASATAALLATATAAQPPLDVGNVTQLFVDDFIVQSSSNCTRTVHVLKPSAVAIKPDAAWEANSTIGVIGTSVLDDGSGRLRAWYTLRNKTNGYDPTNETILSAYAESTDGGQTWRKPPLGLYSIANSSANNVLGPMEASATNAVAIDPNAPPERRYVGISGANHSTSADGINWTLSKRPWNVPCDSLYVGDWGTCGHDTQAVVFWDPPCGCYSLYTRFKNEPPRPPRYQRMQRVARSLSLDSRGGEGQWTNQSIVVRADAIDNASHTSCDDKIPPVDYYGTTPWFDAESGLYLMSAVRFWHWQCHPHNGPGTKDLALMVSRDGARWEFVSRQPLASPSADGTFSSRQVWLAPPGPVSVGDQELYFLTHSNLAEGVWPPVPPAARGGWQGEIRVARLRRHGLISLDAPPLGRGNATITTKPLRYRLSPSARLFLNVDCGASGALDVRVLNATSGAVVATSVAIAGLDSVRAEVQWGKGSTSLAALAGQPVQLVLRMQQNVQLFSVRFEV